MATTGVDHFIGDLIEQIDHFQMREAIQTQSGIVAEDGFVQLDAGGLRVPVIIHCFCSGRYYQY